MLKRYPIRAVKYFLFLLVLFVVLFGAMLALGQTSIERLVQVFYTRSWILLALFVGLPLVYPLIGYAAREVRGNLGEGRRAVERALAMSGYTVTENAPERIVAHASGIKKVSLLFEDRIVVTAEGNRFVRIEGARREVVRIEARIRATY